MSDATNAGAIFEQKVQFGTGGVLVSADSRAKLEAAVKRLGEVEPHIVHASGQVARNARERAIFEAGAAMAIIAMETVLKHEKGSEG